MIRFRTLGTLDLTDGKGATVEAILRRPKLLALLAYLAIARPAGFHRRDTLLALLWPGLDHAHARNALRQAVHALRRALGSQVLIARGEEELGLSREHFGCDVRELEAALDAGRHEEVLALYEGWLLGGLHVSSVPEFERWLEQQRDSLHRRVRESVEELVDRALAAGDRARAVRVSSRLMELAPHDEAAVRRAMSALDRGGDRAGALRVFEEFERSLARDFELEPSAELRALVNGLRVRPQPTSAGSNAPRRSTKADT